MKHRRLKRILALVMVGLFFVTFYSCSGFFSPERVTIRFLNRLSNGNIWAAERLLLERTLNLDRRSAAIYRPLFRTMRFGVVDSQTHGGIARVGVGVQTVDLELLMVEVSSEVTRIILTAGPQRTSRELFYIILQDRLREPDTLPMFNFSGTAQLVRVRGVWRIDLRGSDGLADAITGGMGGIIGY